MNRRRSMFREVQIVESVANGMLKALRDNLLKSEGDGEPLAPLGVWDDLRFTGRKGSGSRWQKADRTNADPPLVDTGNLLRSINVTQVVMHPGTETTGRRYDITISAADYGNEHTSDRRATNVLLGRTKEIRRSRSFGDMTEGVDFVVKKELNVPGRPWNRVTRDRLREIAENAVKGIGG